MTMDQLDATMDLPSMPHFHAASRLSSFNTALFGAAATTDTLARLDSANYAFHRQFSTGSVSGFSLMGASELKPMISSASNHAVDAGIFVTHDPSSIHHHHSHTLSHSSSPSHYQPPMPFYSQPLPNRTISSSSLSSVSNGASHRYAGDLFTSTSIANIAAGANIHHSDSPTSSIDSYTAAMANNNNSNSNEWHCSYGCGKVYRKSSGRSIRRHVVSCFRQRWPGGDSLSEKELSSLIAHQQDQGLLVTGLRRWRMRQSRRAAHELTEGEKWLCPWNCGKFYRSTSSRSIQRHATTCSMRKQQQSLNGDSVSMDEREHEHSNDSDNDSDGENDSEADTRTRVTTKRMKKEAALTLLPSPVMTTSESASSTNTSDFGLLKAETDSAVRFDDDHLYPSSSRRPRASYPQPPPSLANTVSVSDSGEDYRVMVEKRSIAMKLQTLVRDIHSRHGLDHPLFESPIMTPALIQRLIQQQIDESTPQSVIEELVGLMTNTMGTATSAHAHSAAASSVTVPPTERQHSTSSRHSLTSLRQSQQPSSSLLWTCACGASFKITSSKSIQKHRQSCVACESPREYHRGDDAGEVCLKIESGVRSEDGE